MYFKPNGHARVYYWYKCCQTERFLLSGLSFGFAVWDKNCLTLFMYFFIYYRSNLIAIYQYHIALAWSTNVALIWLFSVKRK